MATSDTNANEHGKRRMSSRQATIERHASMELVHRRVKIDPRHNSKQKLRDLREAGQQLNYLHNFLLELGNTGMTYAGLARLDLSFNLTVAKCGDHYENRALDKLTRHAKDEERKRHLANIKALSAIKAKGEKVGRIRYTSGPRSIPLKEYGAWGDYKFVPDANGKDNKKYIRLAKIGTYRVTGGKNIPDDMEFADAVIVYDALGTYIDITGYRPAGTKAREREARRVKHHIDVLPFGGIDANVYQQIFTSEGEVHGAVVRVPRAVRRASRAYSKSKEYAKRHNCRASRKKRAVLKRAYERRSNRLTDAARKEVSALLDRYEILFFQGDDASAWMSSNRSWARELDSNIVRQVLSMLREQRGAYDIGQFEPSTKACGVCGHVELDGIRPGVNSWVCPVCGARLDRQWNAAWVIRLVGVCQLLDEVNFSPSSGVLANLSSAELSWLRSWWSRRLSDRFWNGQVKDVRRKFDVIQDLANVLEAVIVSGGLLETSRAAKRI